MYPCTVSITERLDIRVSRFIETHSRFEYGTVFHALSAAISSLLKEYFILVAQLETSFKQGKLTLQVCAILELISLTQRLWFFVQPPLRTMEILDKITSETMNVFGGSLLHQIAQISVSLAGYEMIL